MNRVAVLIAQALNLSYRAILIDHEQDWLAPQSLWRATTNLEIIKENHLVFYLILFLKIFCSSYNPFVSALHSKRPLKNIDSVKLLFVKENNNKI